MIKTSEPIVFDGMNLETKERRDNKLPDFSEMESMIPEFNNMISSCSTDDIFKTFSSEKQREYIDFVNIFLKKCKKLFTYINRKVVASSL